MNPAENQDDLSPQQLHELAATLRARIQWQGVVIARHVQELRYRQAKIDQLTKELAIHKRWQFGKRSKQLPSAQASLLEEGRDAALRAIEAKLEAQIPSPKLEPKDKPKRQALPPQKTSARNGTVHLACSPSNVLSRTSGYVVIVRLSPRRRSFPCHRRGRPIVGLLAHTLVSKFGGHLPLRDETIHSWRKIH